MSGEHLQDHRSSGLKHGVTFTFFNMSGNFPVLMLIFKIFVTYGAITSELSLKYLALRSSSPVAFVRSRVAR